MHVPVPEQGCRSYDWKREKQRHWIPDRVGDDRLKEKG